MHCAANDLFFVVVFFSWLLTILFSVSSFNVVLPSGGKEVQLSLPFGSVPEKGERFYIL